MSGGGGGVIIIRTAIKTALSDPLVHGGLPDYIQKSVDPVLAKDVNDWDHAEHRAAAHAFDWAAMNC